MSRIHDLLHRAENDKELLRVVDLDRDHESVALPIVVGSSAHGAAFRAEGSDSGAITYQNLLERCPPRRWMPDPSNLVFQGPAPKPAAEEFRGIRSRMYRLRENRGLKTILITSALPGEGKSFTAANLAHAFSIQPNTRVLLIDANLRKPGLHSYLGIPSIPGVDDYLSNRVDMLAVLQRGENENLFFIPAGQAPSGPAEIVSNGRFQSLIETLKPAFDWILIDSPAALPYADSSALAGCCDGVLLVVRSSSTPVESARAARRKFRDGHLIGVVLNGGTAHSDYSEIH